MMKIKKKCAKLDEDDEFYIKHLNTCNLTSITNSSPQRVDDGCEDNAATISGFFVGVEQSL